MEIELNDTIVIDEKESSEKKPSYDYKHSNRVIWTVYIIVSVIVFFLILFRVSSSSTSFDKLKTTDLMNVVAEKTDGTFSSIANSVRVSADMLGASTITDMYVLYHELQATLVNSQYTGIGLINPHGHIYATISEQEEFVKWNLTDLAIESNDVKVSQPYRSGRDGKMVVTFFKSIYKEEQFLGSLFVTYPLDVIEEMIHSDLLSKDADIFLVNPLSENYVVFSSNTNAVGEWSNMKLMRDKLVDSEGSDYNKWNDEMLSDELMGETYFMVDNISYAQVYRKISAMDGWDVVVRMPYVGKSGVTHLYREVVIILGIYFVMISIFIYAVTHSKKRK